MTKFVKGFSARPTANDQTSGSDLGVDVLRDAIGHGLDSPAPTVGISTPADDVGNPGFEIGISTPAGDVGTPGFEIGIRTPTGDLVSPVSTPAGDDTSSGDAGGSLEVLGTAFSIEELTIAEDNDDPTVQKGGGAGVDPTAANPSGGNIGTLLTLGTNPDGSHFFSGNRNVDATLIGSKWGTTNLTFSFPTSGSNYADYTFDSNGVSNYQIVLGAQQQAAARAAFAQLSALTGLTFTEITDTDSVHANIRISQTADQDAPSAYGNFPSDTRPVAGDIWFGRTNQPYYDLAAKGSWGFSTMMHEIGHTMGLKHGHQDYTFADLSFYFGSPPRFGSQSLTADRDGQAWSLMTYSPAPGVGQPFAGDKISQPESYMQYDVAALQYLYGANFNTNSGNTVYTFSQTTGEMFVNGVGQGAPSGNRIFLTIWDGDGNDTIDLSNYSNGVTVDLRPGEWSTADPNQLVNSLAYRNTGVAIAPGNFAMSLLYNNDVRSLIENATGGTGNDLFVGNTANNILDGGAGSDMVIFTSTTGVNVTLNDAATDVIVNHDGETDTLRSIENIGGTSGNDTIIGNSQDNVLTGGSGGTDVLSGGGGADWLIGGGFTVTTNFIVGSPPSQPDITKPQATNNGSIGTAVNTAGAYDIDANANITNATTIPHATINATATGGTIEYYRIDVTGAGAQAIFDIDGGGTLTDSILELVDSAGNLLANNDTGTGDAQPAGHDDAYLTYTFATAGTYYIRVGRFISNSVAQPMVAGQTYTLHISLQGAAGSTTFTANNTSSLVADGGQGNDVVVGTIASDTLTGGLGNDTASFVNAFNGGSSTGVTVDLNLQQGAAQNTVAAGNDNLIGFENLIGSALNDTLIGDNNDNILEGGLGNDTLTGGNGSDTASYAGASAGVTVSLALQGAAQNTVNAGNDTISGFENLLGSAFNDSLTGDANANTLTGGAGDDTLNPGANAGGTIDLLDGGIGSDTASFAGVASGVTATLNGALDGSASIVGGTIATLRSIENLVGSSNADILTGDGNANVIEGGLGDDTLDGGGGIDTLRFTGSTAATVNLATLTAQATGWGNDTITNFENVRTGSGGDNITGDGNDNIFFEGGGNDTYNGAGGIDTVDYSAATSTVAVNLNTVTGQNTGTFGGTDTITNMENVVGAASFGNTLTGNTVGNRLTGGSLGDILVGNNGADVIFGGAGDDILLGGTSGALDDGSADTLEGGLGNDYVAGGQGNDILRGGDGDDSLLGGIGNTSNNFFTNDGGDDTYEGGDGTDTAILTYGNRAGVGASTVGIAFDIGSLAGNSDITWNGVIVGSMSSIERVTFLGSAVNDVVRGGGTLDSLTGNSGDDTLDGWLGNDTLDGGLGNDTLIGGDGLDTATYAAATAGVTVDLRIAGAQNTGGYGIDTLSDIEYLVGSAFGDTLKGSDVFNLITDSGVGAGATALSQTDSIFGYGGNDSILVTRAAAAVSTNINMDGGDGDDFIEFRGGTLSAALAANTSGLVASSGANVTYMALGATSNDRNVDVVTVDGGAGNDRIILSGVASATINAGSGNDTVSISMRGVTSVNNYQITLGSGADVIQFGVGSNAAASTDVMATARTNRVTDFEVGNAGDKFEMTTFLANGVLAGSGYVAANGAFVSSHMRLTQAGTDLLLQVDRDGTGGANSFVTVFAISNGYTGGFTAFNFDGFIGNLTLTGFASDETITGATGNDVLGGGDGNDVLNGLAGNDILNGGNNDDTLNGGDNDDTLNGGAGNDALNGGAGFDTATYAGNVADYTVVYQYDGNGNVIGFLEVTDNNAGNGDEGHDTLNSVEQLSFANVVLNVNQPVQLFNGATLIGTFATIQAAVDAAVDGNTIRAAAGTYAENVVVNKDVTILGANDGLAGTDGSRGAETIISGSVQVTAAGVTIDGVEMTGTKDFGGFSAGIYVAADGFTLINSVLDGPDLGGNSYGILTQQTHNLDVSNNLVEGYAVGIYVSSGGSTGSIHDNLFQGDGGPITGLGNGVNSETSGVTIHDNTFDGLYAGVLNVFPFGPDPVDLNTYIFDNLFTDNAAERVIQIYPTVDSLNFTGTDESEAFNADISGVLGVPFSFVGNGGNDRAFGGALNDTFSGDDGNDRLFGNGGNDTLNGGADDDLIDGGTGTDTAVFADSSLTYLDTVIGWVVGSSEGTDVLQNVEIAQTGSQRNLLVGSTGFASIQAALNAAVDNDFIRVASGTWSGTVNYDDANLVVLAQAGAILNTTFSTATSNGIVVFGGASSDHITTGANSDSLVGGAGADVLTGGGGSDFYVVDQAGDQVIEGAGGGYDIVFTTSSFTLTAGQEIESLGALFESGTDAIDLNGNAFDNRIIGNDGSNGFYGGGGVDVFYGNGGNDYYVVDSSDDVVIEEVGDGIDIVFTTGASYTLAAGSEVEGLGAYNQSGTVAMDLTGNAFNNLIVGNEGVNTINGGAGADILYGNGGADIFAFTTALGGGNVDKMADFSHGTDTVALDDAVFTAIGGLGALNANAFVTGTAAGDADDRIIYDAATGNIFYDADGNGAGAAILFATVNAGTTLTASDFQVI